jgi:hypothetical protein
MTSRSFGDRYCEGLLLPLALVMLVNIQEALREMSPTKELLPVKVRRTPMTMVRVPETTTGVVAQSSAMIKYIEVRTRLDLDRMILLKY